MDINSFALGYSAGKKKGGGSGGGMELNIAYGDTPPEDTSKLWVKTSEPSGVVISAEPEKEIISEETMVRIDTLITSNHFGCAKGVIDGKIYFLGGTIGSVITCFDPETNKFSTLSQTLPSEGLRNMAHATVGNRIYMFGGHNAGTGTSGDRDKIYFFDAETKEVVTLSEKLPEHSPNNPTACAMGTNIILTQVYRSTPNNKLYCFDTLTESLYELPFTLPCVVTNGSLVTDGKYLYFVGGTVDSEPFYGVLKIDLDAQKVTDLHIDLSCMLYGNQAVMVGSKLFVWGSIYYTYSKSYFGTVVADIYTKNLQKSRMTDMKVSDYAFYGSRAVAFGDSIYLFDGYQTNGANGTRNQYVYKFRAREEKILLHKNALHIGIMIGANKVSLIKSDSIEVEAGVTVALKGNENGEGEAVEAAIYKDGKWINI